MRQEIYDKLRVVTDEEKQILQGKTLKKENYSQEGLSRIDAECLMPESKKITIRPHTRFAEFPEHTHNYIEIVYQVNGETHHTINGNASVCLKKGELLMMNQFASHAIDKADIDDVAVNMIVVPSFFDEILPEIGENTYLSSFIVEGLKKGASQSVSTSSPKTAGSISYMIFHVGDVISIQSIMESMIADLLEVKQHYRISQLSMALLFLHLMEHLENADVSSEKCSAEENAVVIDLLREIRESYDTVSLSDFAKKRHTSASYVSRCLKKSTGKTYVELVQKVRVEHAATLLENTDMSVLSILHSVGYSNSSYFHNVFQEIYGISPKQFRDEKRK